MKSIYTLAIIALSVLFLASCGESGNTSKKPKSLENGQQYGVDENGDSTHYAYKNFIIVSEIPTKNGLAHGESKEYFDNGKLRIIRNFDKGKLNGMTIEYYESGEKYMETPYSANKIDGVQYRYKKDGNIVYEVPYQKGEPILGIKEYDGSGKLVEQPTIVFTKKGGNLEMKMSNNTPTAEFYQLVESEKYKAPSENGVGKITLGNARKGDLKIRAIYKTAFGNKAAVDAEY